MFLAKAGSGEVALVDKGYDVDNDLMLVENGVDDDWDDGTEIRLAGNFGEYDNETTGLEDGTALVSTCTIRGSCTRLTIHR